MNYGCAETTHCCGIPCQCCDSNKCRKPWIHIDFSRTVNKTVTKKNGGWAGFGEAPPQGFAVSSMPVMPLNISAMPVSFNSAAAASSVDSDELERLLRELLREKSSAAAAASTPERCDDPCGDIRQLQSDVKQLSDITRNLTAAVAELAKKNQATND